MAKQTFWIGALTDSCQLTNLPYGDTMYDAYVPAIRTWANICHEAFVELGCKLGVGHGQKYTKQADGRWLLVDGLESAA